MNTKLTLSSRERFMEAAQKELEQFERQERELRRAEKMERAETIRLPLELIH